jgi:hypothetical protein
MAGERKGITYEAILYVVLERLRKKGKLKGEIFWNETPDGMTIEPDLLVGADKDRPTNLFLVTHSGSAKNSEMKFWRNMGELVEAKTQLFTVPRVYNVAFDSIIKEGLKKVQLAAFDGQLVVGDESYGKALQTWVDANNASLPQERFEKADAVKKAAGSKGLSTLISRLEADVAKLVGSTNASMKSVWAMERKRPKGKAPTARDTFVRRGLSKLLVFEDVDLALRLYGRQRVEVDEVPEYAFLCGLARKSIGRAVPADREVLSAAAILEGAALRGVIDSAPLEALEPWLTALRHLDHQHLIAAYISDEFDSLSKPDRLYQRLSALHQNPQALVAGRSLPAAWPPSTVWLFVGISELIKADTGKANGFGYAQLAREVADPTGAARGFPKAVREVLLSPWGHISQWVNRDARANFNDEVVKAVCHVLSFRLSAIGASRVAKLAAGLSDSMRKNILEAKLVTYRGFDPLLGLIRHRVSKIEVGRELTCFAAAAELGGQSGKTQVAKAKNTLINWQSASDAGRDHKKKELCGRAVGLRYSWDAKAKAFIKRPGVDKLILVVDGTWRQSDLDALTRAGWDEIFYPDEMDKLAAAIV